MVKVERNKSSEFLHNLCKVFGILPIENFSMIYPICVLIVELVMFLFTEYQKYVYIMKDTSWTIYLMALLNVISVTSSILGCIIKNNFVYRDELMEFTDKCTINTQIEFKKALILMNFLFFFYATSNWCNIWSTYDFTTGLILAYRDVVNYQLGTLYLFLTYYPILLNTHIKTLSENLNSQTITTIQMDKFPKNMGKQYLNITLLINRYNKLFGIDYLFLYINLVINCLTPLNLLYKLSIVTSTNRSSSFIILGIVWFLFPTIYMWIMIKPCDDLTQNCLEIANKCKQFEYVEEINKETRVKLTEFANKIISSPPQVSALNITIVNFNMVTSILSTVATYFIVLIQFNQ